MVADFTLDSDSKGEFCIIPLSKSIHGQFFANIDVSKFEDIGQYKWSAWQSKRTKLVYAVRNTPRTNGKHNTIKMHRQILNINERVLVDHIDGNGLNNRRYNLRVATNAQNQWNMCSTRGTSRYKGVCWHIHDKKWAVALTYLGERIWIGEFASEIVGDVDIGEIKAAKAYDEAARKYFGVFARLNFPEQDE